MPRLMHRVEGTFLYLVSCMQILASQKTIGETVMVSKLTKLAFFLLPLTLVTGVFGMNVAVGFSCCLKCTWLTAANRNWRAHVLPAITWL